MAVVADIEGCSPSGKNCLPCLHPASCLSQRLCWAEWRATSAFPPRGSRRLSEERSDQKSTESTTSPNTVGATLGRKIVVGQGVGEADLRSGIWTRGVVRARRLVCQAAKREMVYSEAEMARFLGVTTSSVNRVTVSEILSKVRKYLTALQNLHPAFPSCPAF